MTQQEYNRQIRAFDNKQAKARKIFLESLNNTYIEQGNALKVGTRLQSKLRTYEVIGVFVDTKGGFIYRCKDVAEPEKLTSFTEEFVYDHCKLL